MVNYCKNRKRYIGLVFLLRGDRLKGSAINIYRKQECLLAMFTTVSNNTHTSKSKVQ